MALTNKHKAQRRVMVARDVIKQLDMKRYVGMRGVYVHAAQGIDDQPIDVLLPAQPIAKRIKRCEVCALGAIFVSYARKLNEVEATIGGRRGLHFDQHRGPMYDLFTGPMLSNIEAAFEGWLVSGVLGKRPDTTFVALRERVPDDSERLRMIMQNIIDNDGTFVPADLVKQKGSEA